jgi:hypothetical protein
VIQDIKIENFKSLREVDLKLGALNLFIGTNSSGKSNFLDALRVLQGIGYGFTFDEILNGKPRSASTEVWEPIRGGSAKATYSGAIPGDQGRERFISFRVNVQTALSETLFYYVAFSAEHKTLHTEEMSGVNGNIYSIQRVADSPLLEIRYQRLRDLPRGPRPPRELHPGRLGLSKKMPGLHQFLLQPRIANATKDLIQRLSRAFTNTQRIEPVPSTLREYSIPQSVRRMGEHGENFAALVKTIISDPAAKSGYLSWLQNLTPTEVDDVLVLEGALGEPLFALKERNVEYPAPVLPDGTLRFAAIAAAFFQPDMPDLITIEEIENGIHPTRLRLLVELLKTQSIQTGRQIIATTHSPVVLAC